MGTGIVSIALFLDHRNTLSRIVFALAALAWLALALLLAYRLLHHRQRVQREASTPAALTGVAATAVLGTRVTGFGWDAVAVALLVLAAVSWAWLIVQVLRSWATPTSGTAFMVVVSTQSLAVLAAFLARVEGAAWLVYAALVLLVLGLGLYVFVLRTFDFRQLAEGNGDQWITGGALAISTLALTRVTAGLRPLHVLPGWGSTLETLSVVLWALTLAWLPILIATEVRWPRPRYDLRRWATVFPVGMYAVCSFDTGAVAHAAGITEFARIWVWVAVALWVLVSAAMVRRLVAYELTSRRSSRRISRADRSS